MKTIVAAAVLLGAFSGLVLGADLPRKATEIGIALPDGKLVSPTEYKGKVVILAFILTT